MSDAATDDAPPAAGLTWSIKRRFVAYLAGLPDGAFSVADGATRGGENVFTFPPLGGSSSGAGIVAGGLAALPLRFGGVLRLSGHLGMMHVKIAAPTIETSGSGTFITIADPDDEAPGTRVPFAQLTLPDPAFEHGFVTWAGVHATLTREGSEIFAARYVEGEPLDQLTIRLPLPAASATRI